MSEEKKLRLSDGMEDIFLSIISAAKILRKWQYQELTVWDKDTGLCGAEYKVYIVSKESVEALKEYRMIIDPDYRKKVEEDAK